VLLVIALVGLASHSSSPQVERAVAVVVTHASDADLAGVVATRATGHALQLPAWSGSGLEADSAHVLGAALLVSLLLGLVRSTPLPSRSARSLPWWRGPPQLPFVN